MSTDSLLLVLLVVDIISKVLSTQTAKSVYNNECGKLLFVYAVSVVYDYPLSYNGFTLIRSGI